MVKKITRQVTTIFCKKQAADGVMRLRNAHWGPKTSLEPADLYRHYGENDATGRRPALDLRRPRLVDSDYSKAKKKGEKYEANFR